MMGKKAVFITVRSSSTRLTRKCFLPIAGLETIRLLIQRLKKRTRSAQEFILCTTLNPEDEALVKIAQEEGILFFRGSENDKLARWHGAAREFGVEFFVTADGDDLLCEPELIDLALAQADRTGADFIEAPMVACGAFTYGIRAGALAKVCEIKNTEDTEMMWVYFKDTGLFKVELLQDSPEIFKRPDIRMTLDYPDDLRFFEIVLSYFKGRETEVSLREIMVLLEKRPELIRINQHLQEEFLRNQARKTKLVLRAEP